MAEKDQLNKITEPIIGAAIDVHQALGPRRLEPAYETLGGLCSVRAVCEVARWRC